jgi:hypothetical protein
MKTILVYTLAVLLFCINFGKISAVGPEQLPPWPGSGAGGITCNCAKAFPCSAFEEGLCAYACNAPGDDGG